MNKEKKGQKRIWDVNFSNEVGYPGMCVPVPGADEPKEEPTRQSSESVSIITKTEGCTIHCLTIVGQIEGHYLLGAGQKTTKYENIIPLLAAIEQSDETEGLLIILNTVGGDVEAGLAIAEMIASMEKPTVSLVLGGGHSIGVPLAVAAKYSFIVPSSTMTIHPVRMNGLVVGVPQTFSYFSKMQDRIVRFVSEHSSVSEETFRSLVMRTDEIATDVGSIIDGEEAVRVGIIDSGGGLSSALDKLRQMIREKNKAKSESQNQTERQNED